MELGESDSKNIFLDQHENKPWKFFAIFQVKKNNWTYFIAQNLGLALHLKGIYKCLIRFWINKKKCKHKKIIFFALIEAILEMLFNKILTSNFTLY